ncbi:MAG: CAP domain-containing protein [Rhodobacter sp.]|nr:CAP domain-containing protein [Rhodobacter sp.]
MMRILTLLIVSMFLVSCGTTVPQMAADGKPLPRLYRISKSDTSRIQFRMLDSINALRQAAGVGQVTLNAQLNAAAATHSRDMAVQNRPWHFGSDGSSPIERVQRAGYTLTMLGENISETFETELETLAAWMETPDTRSVIMDRRARDLGFAWHQESGGKIWWTLIMGGGGASPRQPAPTPSAQPQG